MNVAFDPWIPVVTTSGERGLASLCDVLAEGEKFIDLAVRPHERVALMRLFLCIAHAALNGPKDYGEWCEVSKRLPDAAQKYLMHWKDSFELFHESKPWLQVAKLKPIPSDKCVGSCDEKSWSSLSKLCFTRASGHNSTLFDHESNDGVPTEYREEEIALNLLTFQNFFVAGGKASSRLWGDIKMKNPSNPKGGPCSGKSILFTFLRNRNLSRSVHMNMNTYEDLKLVYGDSGDWLGKPLWEMPIKSPTDNESIANATQTHIGRLVPQTRILRINQDFRRVLLGAGFLYPKFQDEKNTFHPDLFATTVLNVQGERALLSANPNIAIWRELHALAVRRKDASALNRGPLCLLNVTDGISCDIIVNSMMTNPKQPAEIVNLFESVFHIPAQLLMAEGTVIYEEEVNKADSWSSLLSAAVSEYRKDIDDKWNKTLMDFEKKASAKSDIEKARSKKYLEAQSPLYSTASTHYWTTVENHLPLLLAHIKAIGTDDATPTRDAWRKMLFASACDAYRIACGQETPRQMRAFAKGFQKLTGKRKKSKSNKTIKEVNA